MEEEVDSRYYQDVETLKKFDNNTHTFTEQDLKLLNINPENYIRWKRQKESIEQYESLKREVMMMIHDKNYDSASETIVDYIESHFYIYTTKDDKCSEIWIYRDGIYIPNGKSEIKEICREILSITFNQFLLNRIVSKIEADTFIEPSHFFKNIYKDEIPVLNGILNIKTRELSSFDPKKIFFNKLPVKYDKSEVCPKIDQFLTDVLAHPDDKIVFYEIAGFGLIKDYTLEKAVMMIGDGRNGKGKSLELLKRLVGVENCVSLPLMSLIPESFSLSELFGKLYNLAGDLSSIALKDTGMFKSLTGRDIISARRKFLKDIVFTNYAKFIFACNELPRVYDYSIGFWERWILLEFPYRFVDRVIYDSAKAEDKLMWKIKDDSIIDKISVPEELSGFLNQALDGLDRITQNKRFSYSKGTDEIKNTWIRRSDSFMAFCLDFLEEDSEGKITKKDIRNVYMKYCKKHKLKGVSDRSIKATLQENFGVSEEYSKVFDDYQVNVWTGIRWKTKKGYI